ncbi:PREDICTED: programmed cell death protein 2 [Condylura cristata]|uniref:programmed cell death protein 2 n=1 Tax=Condylura cristata TaxID=143302 RepID=UPI0006428AC0|nr:PREDICTED: programmed cell death protein 2 [Condylura cristata]
MQAHPASASGTYSAPTSPRAGHLHLAGDARARRDSDTGCGSEPERRTGSQQCPHQARTSVTEGAATGTAAWVPPDRPAAHTGVPTRRLRSGMVLVPLLIDAFSDAASGEELDSLAKHESREDKVFQKFKTKTDLVPEQILRYGRGIAPVWISGENVPREEDIPDCPCGAKRIFEFQVMPQLLYYLKADRLGRSVDWGVLAIFTCAESCRLGTGYAEEFVWKQDVAAAP